MKGFKKMNVFRKFNKNKLVSKAIFAGMFILSSSLLMGDWNGSSSDVYTMGKVGIGTTTPTQKFEVADGIISLLETGISQALMSYHNGRFGITLDSAGTDGIYFRTYSNGYEDRLVIKSDGRVGIGMANPGTKLHVAGPIAIRDAEGSNAVMSYSNGKLNIGLDSAGSDGIYFRTYSNGYADRLVIKSNGYVGICGISEPIEALHVGGNVKATGTVTAQNYACSSDSRYKKDIATLPDALSKVLSLRGVNYFWNTEKYKDKNFTSGRQIGFLAQEVEKVLPELVFTDSNGYKSVSYDKMSAVIVEAVKEMKAKSDTRISTLEKENKLLKQRIALLEKMNERVAKIEKMIMQEKVSKAW